MRKRDRSPRKAMFEPMEDDDSESNASGFIGIAPMQATNKDGDLEQAVEISLKNNRKYGYKESALNMTLSTEASSSPHSKEVLPDVQKKFRNVSERSLPRPDVTPRRTRSRSHDTTNTNSIPFDEEVPSNPAPTTVNKEICGTSWWKQMNSSGRKVRNPTLCPYSPMGDGLCCPQTSVPGMILEKSTVRDDVSDFELDGAWDPDDTSVPSQDGDQFTTSQQQRSVTSSNVRPSVVTPSPQAKQRFSSVRPKTNGGSRLVLGASSRQQSRFELDQIVLGSEKEV